VAQSAKAGLKGGDQDETGPAPRGQETSRWNRIKMALLPYRMGTRRLKNNIQVAYHLVTDSLLSLDRRLSHRERRLVLRTVMDLLRLLPFIVIAAAPGGSMLLPILARVFPGSLPTTFKMPSAENLQQSSSEPAQERALQKVMEQDFRRAVEKMTQSMHRNQVKQHRELSELVDYALRTDTGLPLDGQAQLLYARFSDGDILDALNVGQLESLVRHFNRPAGWLERYASDRYRFSILRYTLERHLSRVSSEDVLLAEEGAQALSAEDLLEACVGRGLCPGLAASPDAQLSSSASALPPAQAGEAAGHPGPAPPDRAELELRLNAWLYAAVTRSVPAALLAFAHMQKLHCADDDHFDVEAP